MNKLPLPSVQQNKLEGSDYCSILAGRLLGLLFNPDNGRDTFLRNIVEHVSDYTAVHATKYQKLN
jgi:hypothetical protein